MSRFAKAFHLTCAIIASLTCVVYTVIVGMLLFHWRTITPHPDPAKFFFFVLPALVLGAGAMMEFSFYNDERNGLTSHEEGSLVASGGDTVSTGFVLITTSVRGRLLQSRSLYGRSSKGCVRSHRRGLIR